MANNKGCLCHQSFQLYPTMIFNLEAVFVIVAFECHCYATLFPAKHNFDISIFFRLKSSFHDNCCTCVKHPLFNVTDHM